MKIVLSSFLYEPDLGGGAAAVVNQLAHLLINTDFEVVILTTWAGTQVKTEDAEGVKVIRLPASNLYWIADKDRQSIYKKVIWQLIDIWNPVIYRLAREIFIKEAPDILHSHKLRGLSPSIWSAAASVGVKKIIHTCHDFELLSPEGLLMGRVGRLAQEQNLVMRPYQNIRRHFSKLVKHVIAPSQFLLNMHHKMDFFPQADKDVIPNTHGFNVTGLHNTHSELLVSTREEETRRFLYIGRLDHAKGVDLLCQVFSQLEGQGQSFLLTIAGWGSLDVSLRKKYKDQANIEFVGPVFGRQKAALFKDSDALIAPSIAPESFGIVITEAYSYGLPVIASRIGGYSEIVKDGLTGFLVEPNSAEKLSSAILRIGADKNLLQIMSEHCYEEAEKYTTEKFLDSYLNVYKRKV